LELSALAEAAAEGLVGGAPRAPRGAGVIALVLAGRGRLAHREGRPGWHRLSSLCIPAKFQPRLAAI